MASSFALTIQRETAITGGLKEKAQAAALAEAGINYAILMLLSNDNEQRWQANSSLYEIELAGKRIRMLIADEAGKININLATNGQLQQLFDSLAIDEELADSLSDAILDWRDKNDLHRVNGAEMQQYEEAGLSYTPRNGAFKSVEEVQMVLGMTADIYKQLEGKISVYTKNKKINPVTATREVLLTLPDVNAAMVDEYLLQRVESERNGETVAQPEWYSGSGKSNVYMIIAEAMIAKDISEKIMAIMKRGHAKNDLPFEILKWAEDYPMPSLFLPGNDKRVIN
ncbi:general secretion pathway protein GspK [Bathymodiolus japonicus methanotrophic gill symbiont]|uniref:general secretion pathway protein GspK n=1 Tax=Bathymodiolus japonicus methanotrophic gill symbiont TaxID=113269 RepID=UPI001C8EFDAD|nr:type II secretion system protein GspK [Bathymodiolus japonicus methanotrophic gill symbiont]